MLKRHTPEEKAKILKEAKTKPVEEVCKDHKISSATFYNWKNGGRKTKVVRAINQKSPSPTKLLAENQKLKSIIADLLVEQLDTDKLASLLRR